jgi:hypothetical protein
MGQKIIAGPARVTCISAFLLFGAAAFAQQATGTNEQAKQPVFNMFQLRPDTDTDGDGIADDRDRCPDSGPGMRINNEGCSAEDVANAPERLIDPVLAGLRQAAAAARKSTGTEQAGEAIEQGDLIDPIID